MARRRRLHCLRGNDGGLLPRRAFEPAGAVVPDIYNEESMMSNPKQAAQGSAATAKKEKLTFKQMSRGQKTVFILKLTVSILSFGMLYPNLMSD
jgi:hypothetical protein